MGSWRNLAVFTAATCVALGAAREAGASATDFYGNNFDENVLVPYAQCGPGGNDTLFAVTNPGVPAFTGGFVHVFVYNRDSIEACDFVVPFTPADVYPDSFCRILADECGDVGRTLLDNGDGSSVAYITVEGENGAGVDVDTGDAFYGNVYYTDLGNNRATGLPAATFDPTAGVGAPFDSIQLNEFPLLVNHQLSFRFLQALAGDRNAASTRGIIWSATTLNCINTVTGPVPDSNCLVGTGASASVNYCDEAERCTSGPRPPVNREINIFSVDSFIPGSFATDGGYFNLQGIEALTGGAIGGFDQLDVIHVIGITDQEATIGGTPAVRAAYYAPRD